MKVGHIVNSFDPACDVLRCVRELNKYSKHFHTLYVQDSHPHQEVYQYDQPERPGWEMTSAARESFLAEAEVLIYHFRGREQGINDTGKPSGFRNLCSYYSWDRNRFWTEPHYNSDDYDYDLLAASHVGARDFMHPQAKFRWLPDLLPLNWAYTFDPSHRPPTVSYIKHAAELSEMNLGEGTRHQDLSETAHATVLAKRRSDASVVIDNLSDGHYGLAGQEAAILGLPVLVYNHKQTLDAMREWRTDGAEFPFYQVETLEEAAYVAAELAQRGSLAIRRKRIRRWAEKFFDPRFLIGEYWDTFIMELAS